MTTRAAVCENLSSGRVRIDEEWAFWDSESLGPRSVHVKCKCAGLNFAEFLQLKGQYQEKLEPPFVPGNEVSGIVEAVGAEVTAVKPGDAVVALPRGGGWARDVVVNEALLMPVGQGGDFAEAAALAVAYGTAHMALVERARLLKGETVLVTAAAGGVGLAAVELATHFGANVIACASSQEKLDVAKDKGAKAGLLSSAFAAAAAARGGSAAGEEDPKKLWRDELRRVAAPFGGVDVAIDMVGGALLEPVVRSLNFDGRAVVVGFASGTIPKIPANVLLVKNVALLGLYWGSYAKKKPATFHATARDVAALWHQRHIVPTIHHRYPLSRVNDAVHDVQARKTTGKVILDLDE